MNDDRHRAPGKRWSIRVVKVGGSLLDWPELPTALPAWLADQPPAANVLLGGGGSLADAVREADRTFGLGEQASHGLCVELLGATARLLAALLPGATLLTTYDELLATVAEPAAATTVLDPRELLTTHEPRLPGVALPHTWDATSDSIAARLAQVLKADELVLLKSVSPPPLATHRDLAASGYLDRFFPTAAAGLKIVRLVNLRGST
jgi:5-(aminomethyl)-3-furanmethanol phosphate kinase